ncbi:SDR family oxidoreductase [Rhodococcus ruber]|uniref:SDR family oxidoreductase n=1 Tax=Rhodococcus ruber TaxID=1830 RepID=A0ABT4MF64_9NOCA|nr:SDR family oxidoreductase [Rhodococcus ruber]MCZ4519468.1 SDR family oxidoreductase [Rhodococcus ruber]
MRLKDKIAIITGGGKGLGRETAELFASEGAIVYAGDVVLGDYQTDGVHQRHLDVSDPDDWTALVDEIVETHGGLDILVNNASIVKTFDVLTDVTLDDWNSVLNVNLTGTFLGLKTAIPAMVKSNGGSIVNIASTVALTGTPTMAPYGATKGGIRTLTKHVAVTYAAAGIRSNSVFPGLIDTGLLKEAGDAAIAAVLGMTPIGRAASTREIANGILFLASDEASYMTGSELVIDGGFVAV